MMVVFFEFMATKVHSFLDFTKKTFCFSFLLSLFSLPLSLLIEYELKTYVYVSAFFTGFGNGGLWLCVIPCPKYGKEL